MSELIDDSTYCQSVSTASVLQPKKRQTPTTWPFIVKSQTAFHYRLIFSKLGKIKNSTKAQGSVRSQVTQELSDHNEEN